MSSEQQFHAWLQQLPESIEILRNILAEDTGQTLDFSIDSLLMLEQWLLERYPDLKFIHENDEYHLMEAAGGYIGETIRQVVGGEWTIELKDEAYAYLGVPGIGGFKGNRRIPSVYPLTWATTSLNRRTGEYIRTLAERLINRVETL